MRHEGSLLLVGHAPHVEAAKEHALHLGRQPQGYWPCLPGIVEMPLHQLSEELISE